MKQFGDQRDWFIGPKLGLFVHWGLYAINAWHEQEQIRRAVPRKEYEKLISQFNPQNFDPNAWLDMIQDAGMEYICFTTKHHDGFCMWDTAQTEFKVTNSSYGKDILGQLADACHNRNFPLCLYYSVVDWNQPNYPNKNKSHELGTPESSDNPDLPKYLEFLKAQVRELCTNYGKIHGIW
jgi:alpha-L-fucosidase